jgi:serine/threonine-protein kinase
MEYLDGMTVRERLDRGALPPEEALRILQQLAEGLDTAHAQGVLHRDIKPSNVMLLPDGRAKLTDFGVARLLDDATMTHAGATIGSPAYMAPEQVRGEAASPASDRWALGVLLYEMLSGQPPFRGDNVASVWHQVAYDPPPPLTETSVAISAVVQKSLAKSPQDRYDSARELVDALRAALDSEGAPAIAPIGPGERIGEKGGTVAARRTMPRTSRAWKWALPVALLLTALPLLLQWPLASRSNAPERRLEPVRVPRPAGVRVTERSKTDTTPAVKRTSASEVRSNPSTASAAKRSPARQSVAKRPAPPRARVATARPTTVRRVAREAAPEREPKQSTRVARASKSPRPRAASRNPSPVRLARRVETPRPRSTSTSQRASRTGQSATALNNRAYRLQRQGRHREAEPLLREALRKNPNYAYAQYNLGWSLLSQGRAREALAPLQRTAARQPGRWEPQHRLGQAYEKLGETEKARAAYQRARALR